MLSLNIFPSNREKKDLDARARADVPGSFVNLADGVTHYELAGPADGPCVVLVHGFSVPYYLWDHTFQPLAEAGFRVLRYDLFGRGWSDRPKVTYDPDLYDRQLCGLLEALGVRTPVDVIGSSMGGAISTHFTARHPQRVRKLVLIDPAGLLDRMPFPMSLLELPHVGSWMMALYGEKALTSGLRADLYDAETYGDYVGRYMEQMEYRGFKRALLSTLQCGVLSCAQEAYRQVGKQKRPVLLIWGRDDQTIPLPISERVRAFLLQAEFRVIDDAGHIPHYECPQIINPMLAAFLRREE